MLSAALRPQRAPISLLAWLPLQPDVAVLQSQALCGGEVRKLIAKVLDQL